MKSGMVAWGSLVGTAMVAIACGGSAKAPDVPGSASVASAAAPTAPDLGDAGGGAAQATAAGGAATPAPSAAAAPTPPPPPARPFAKNAEEATSLIDDAISSRSTELGQCVDAARARRKNPHEKIIVEVGIDQEGHMLGVQLPKKEKQDKVLVDCVLAALSGAPFPRSHAGVITVRRTFEDKAVYR